MNSKGKLLPVILVTAALLAGLSVEVLAGKKDKVSGKTAYKANCKVCHDSDSDAGEYTPMSLIMDQWERFFEKKYEPAHKDVKFKGKDGRKVTEVLTPELMKAIKKFCVDHAADSEQPMTCG